MTRAEHESEIHRTIKMAERDRFERSDALERRVPKVSEPILSRHYGYVNGMLCFIRIHSTLLPEKKGFFKNFFETKFQNQIFLIYLFTFKLQLRIFWAKTVVN